eukprot:7343841-Prymnesium_polylepis.1
MVPCSGLADMLARIERICAARASLASSVALRASAAASLRACSRSSRSRCDWRSSSDGTPPLLPPSPPLSCVA